MRMQKGKGFTLIELMIVIAIIIILVATAIPNYSRMVKGAEKAIVISDMASVATVLEAFRTDWGKYPIVIGAEAIDAQNSVIYSELSGKGTAGAINVVTNTNTVGETVPIDYIKAETLQSFIDPIKGSDINEDGHIYYFSDPLGQYWTLYAYTGISTVPWTTRTDSSSGAVDVVSLNALTMDTIIKTYNLPADYTIPTSPMPDTTLLWYETGYGWNQLGDFEADWYIIMGKDGKRIGQYLVIVVQQGVEIGRVQYSWTAGVTPIPLPNTP